APNDLLAEELGTKSTHAQHMGDRVGIPTLGEHGNRYDTTNRSTQLTVLAHSIHNFAKQRYVVQFLPSLAILRQLAAALNNLASESLDLVGSHVAEVIVQTLP